MQHSRVLCSNSVQSGKLRTFSIIYSMNTARFLEPPLNATRASTFTFNSIQKLHLSPVGISNWG